MTDQPTTTDQPTAPTAAEPEAVAEPVAENRAATAERAAADQQPTGTRELRDAQASGERAASESRARRSSGSGTQARPPIRAAASQATESSEQTESAARQNAPLFDEAAGRQLRERWLVIQTEFVDEPRDAVQKADALVAEVLKQLTDTFAREREELEAGWSGSGDGAKREVSTEDLRQAIQRYRSFFNRLLAL